MSKLLTNVANEIRRRDYSYRTEQAYLGWIKRFVMFNNKIHPLQIPEKKVVEFLNHLVNDKNVASSTQNQALCAIAFLYKQVLKKPLGILEELTYSKKYKTLPVVLTRAEVRKIVQHLQGAAKLMVQLMYGTGLRISECQRLRVLDVDFGNALIQVRNGKGRKDRITLLPNSLEEALSIQIKKVEHLHQKDMLNGQSNVPMPKALSVKYPNAAKQLKWQYVFPSRKIATDPRTGQQVRYHQSGQWVNRKIAEAVLKAEFKKSIGAYLPA